MHTHKLNNLYLINSMTAINLHANDMLNYSKFSSSFDSKQAEQYARFDVDGFCFEVWICVVCVAYSRDIL